MGGGGVEKLPKLDSKVDVVTTFEREAAAEGEKKANIEWFMED